MCKSLFILVNGASECKEGEKSRKHAKKARQKRPEATDELFCDLVCEPSTSPSKNRGQKAAKCTMEGLAKALTWPFSEKQRAEPRQKPWSQLGASAQEPPRSYISASFGRVAAKASHRRRARGRFAGREGTKEQPKAAENGLAARPEALRPIFPHAHRGRAPLHMCTHCASVGWLAWPGWPCDPSSCAPSSSGPSADSPLPLPSPLLSACA